MIDFAKVFPRLKETYDSTNPIRVATDEGKEITLSAEDSPVMIPFAENLSVSYAVDHGTHYQFVSNRDLSDTVTVEKLHTAALQNMITEIADNIQAHGDPTDVLMLTNGGNYEAAMLIWDDIWTQIESVVGGAYYVAVPARDLVYVAPKSNPDAIARLKELINRLFDDKEAFGLMVRHIYHRIGDKWEIVTTA